ncbi:sulfate adenylyltransferase [Roseivirga misakiensis]|uniref:sulfate adenylyltransferase n=2 Tax=Roseivirga misakiensis TaxID=1563681 RepID=A0A1E5SK72_9BACT|nr:sulfate adenylyltransferase [Roseivirga misakiensis]
MAISRNKSVLRIATAGSVDDGKSTLIGRLLYDTNSIETDKLLAIEESSRRKGLDYTDLSLLTDGLVAEREQGITIDVAHIYFSTPSRKFIIADTPGHIEYTRNMVTGASNADLSIVLVDARNGMVEQTYRHLYIAKLLKVPKIVVCVNKMDLVAYSQERFNEIVKDFHTVLDHEEFENVSVDFIPVSSLYGENIASRSNQMEWYLGDVLLTTLEAVDAQQSTDDLPARFPVQHVIRPKSDEFHDYRGYAGRVASGDFRVGDEVSVLPSGLRSKIKSLEKFDGKLNAVSASESVVLRLEDDIDVSRGDMIVKDDLPTGIKQLSADVCWMDSEPLFAGKGYRLQHGINQTRVKVSAISHKLNTSTFDKEIGVSALELNDIGKVSLKLAKPIFADSYAKNRDNGAFILIDEATNNTVGVGFVD